jgi:hypothetical protein
MAIAMALRLLCGANRGKNDAASLDMPASWKPIAAAFCLSLVAAKSGRAAPEAGGININPTATAAKTSVSSSFSIGARRE